MPQRAIIHLQSLKYDPRRLIWAVQYTQSSLLQSTRRHTSRPPTHPIQQPTHLDFGQRSAVNPSTVIAACWSLTLIAPTTRLHLLVSRRTAVREALPAQFGLGRHVFRPRLDPRRHGHHLPERSGRQCTQQQSWLLTSIAPTTRLHVLVRRRVGVCNVKLGKSHHCRRVSPIYAQP